ncbi:MAG: glycosyltransferase [Candidatus Micrarchaeia archaeon]
MENTISVVIPAFNEKENIGACIRSLRKQTLSPIEIIVVDGGSTDGTVAAARSGGARVIVEKKRRGAGAARNAGASLARGSILAFTDADSLPDSDWLERITSCFRDPSVVCVGGPLSPTDGGLPDRFFYALFSDWFPRLASLAGFYSFHGSNLAVRKKAFERAGGFSETLLAIEDNELANRMKGFGRVVFDSRLTVAASPRRFRRFGYFREALRYWSAGIRHYLFGKPVEDYALVR